MSFADEELYRGKVFSVQVAVALKLLSREVDEVHPSFLFRSQLKVSCRP